jgi:hypothetical protein
MDEIAAVRSFRGAVPQREHASRAAAWRTVTAGLEARRPRRTRFRSRRGWVLVAVALAAVIAVSSALGWTSRLVDAIAGEPAPPRVKRYFAVQNEARAREAMAIFRGSADRDAIVERAHGVLGIETSVGAVIIWAAPTRGGGLCYVVEIERLRLPDGRPNGHASCGPRPDPPDRPMLQTGRGMTRVGEGYLHLLHGRARAEVASVELRWADGRRETLPVVEGFYLYELRPGDEPAQLIARDGAGRELARERTRPLGLLQPAERPAGPERVLIRLRTSTGHPLTFALARGKTGGLCRITRYRGTGRTCGPDPRLRLAPDGLSVHPGLWNEAEDGKPLVTLQGVVGAEIERLQLRYADGAAAEIPIVEQFVVFEVPVAHHRDERFVLVGYDAEGNVAARGVVR